jgi:hypothetical protein
MLRRYLPLLFVILVVAATAAAFLIFRGPGGGDPQAERGAETKAERTVAADGIPEYHVSSEAEYQATLEALGTSMAEIETWARSQGFPPRTYTELPDPPLERDYGGEEDERLLELAERGDRWAMHFLAARIGPEMPLEAIDWYRTAVVHGSAYSAFTLGNLYQKVLRWALDEAGNTDQVSEIAQREDPLAHTSLAWLIVSEYAASLPPGAMSSTQTNFRASDEAITQACIRAAGFLAEVEAERKALGLEVPRRKPPLAVELPGEETAGYCDPEVFPRADYSDCETLRLVGDRGAILAHRCR